MAVGTLGGISLLVGGVGIMTISVTERTGEIGLLSAIGAQRSTILVLFLGESIMLSFLGGLLGLSFGIGVAQLLRLVLAGLPVHTPWIFSAGGLLISILIGLLAGVAPAIKASRMNPVDALRAE